MNTPNNPHSPTTASAPKKRGGFIYWLGAALLIVLIDQCTKQLISSQFHYAERLNVLPFFDLTLLYNPGAAFSFLANEGGWQRWFFTAIALVATLLIIHMLHKNPHQRLFCASLSLILGGALGNVIDRVWHGHVIDFLLFYWKNAYFPAFNVADIAISCGAILLVLDELIRLRKHKKRKAIKD